MITMGRGRGGYTEKQTSYKDSGGHKVTDPGVIFVAERYIDQGYEAVFRQEHPNQKNYDLTIKTSDDSQIIKNVEVKKIESDNPSQMAKNLKKAFTQVGEDGTVAVYLPHHSNCPSAVSFAQEAYAEAVRKGWIKGSVEVWFNDKTKINL